LGARQFRRPHHDGSARHRSDATLQATRFLGQDPQGQRPKAPHLWGF
jgi:hypothetical protein